MQDRLLAFLFELGRRRGRWVMVAATLLTLLGAALATRTRISTSQRDLVPPHHPVQRAYNAFVQEFGAADSLIAVLDGEPEVLRAAVEPFAAELRRQPSVVKSVFYKIDLNLMREHAPLFAPLDVLERAGHTLQAQRPLIEQAAAIHNLPDLLLAIGAGFSKPDVAADPAVARALLTGVGQVFGEWKKFLDDPAYRQPAVGEALLAAAGDNAVVRAGGYLASRDGRLVFLFVQPTSSSDDASFLRPFITTVREAYARVLAQHPQWQGRMQLGLTGLPAHVLTETQTVFNDVGNGMVLSVVLVVAIVLIGFRTLRKMALAVLPLVCGMVVGLGVVILVLGRLNLISAAFMAVMFGMSIDFGIYLIRRTEEELGRGVSREEAVRTAMLRTGRGVLTGGLTTCAAFVAITLSDFAGFAELGVTAGIGILVCLASVFVLFPALALRLRLEPARADLESVAVRAARPGAQLAMRICAVVVMGLTVWAGWACTRLRFDYDALALLPQDTESTRYQLRMQKESDFQISTAMMVADNLPELRQLVTRARALPEVARVESLADFIPEDQKAKLGAITQLRPLADLQLHYVAEPLDPSTLRAHVDGLVARFADAEEAAFSAGKSELVAEIGKIKDVLASIGSSLAQLTPAEAQARTTRFEAAIFANARAALDLVRGWVHVGPLNEGDLAPEVLARFKSPAGHYVAYVIPRGSVWDVAFLDRFVAQLKAVTTHVTGFPVTHQVYSRMVVHGFRQAMLYAFIAVVILLALDFRRVRPVLLSLLPLGLGFLLLQLLVWAAGVQYNYANIAAFPVLMGYGVAYGVNIVQRWLEAPHQTAFISAATIGKGVLLSAGTTLAGLGSIVLARHRGVATFGFLLLGSVSLCLVLATLVLPVVIDLLHRRRPP